MNIHKRMHSAKKNKAIAWALRKSLIQTNRQIEINESVCNAEYLEKNTKKFFCLGDYEINNKYT